MTARMTEPLADAGRGISLAYEQFGSAGADPLVLDDLPPGAWPLLIDLIASHARRRGRSERTGSSDAVTTS